MLFNSLGFIFVFLPVSLLVALALRRRSQERGLILWLALVSIAFYAVWSPAHVPLLVASIGFNFLVGRAITRRVDQGARVRGLLVLGVATDLAVLGVFKYAGFIVQSLNATLHSSIPVPNIELPVGISFFTFTQIAFLVDAARHKAQEYDFDRFTLFVSYFPHLVAGPVLHHGKVIPQFESERFCRWDSVDVCSGALLFAIGLSKKVLLADPLAPFADAAFSAAAAGTMLTMWESWGGLLAFAFQLYFDFSGYSDMAVGLSLLLGVDLPINFNSPYRSASIIDFWRRWHISLSNFLRDYLYIALGGNRHGTLRRYVNLLLTMLLGGLWHGAAWTFVLWGGLHGLYLLVNHGFREWMQRVPQRWKLPVPTVVSWALTFVAVTLAWAFFRAADTPTAIRLLGAAMGSEGLAMPQSLGAWSAALASALPFIEWRFEGMFANGLVENTRTWVTLVGVAAFIAFALPNSVRITAELVRPQGSACQQRGLRPRALVAAIYGVLLALALLGMQRNSPFIYFQF